jgi:hypothetical protein
VSRRGPLLAVALAGLGLLGCSSARPRVGPAPEAVPDAVALRLDEPVGQVSRYREVGDVMGLEPLDMAAPRVFETLFWTRTVTARAGDTATVAMVFDSLLVGPPPGARFDRTTLTRYDGAFAVTRVDAQGEVRLVQVAFRTRLPAALIAIGQGEPFSAGRRPDLRVPAHPVRVGDAWSDSMPVRLVRGVPVSGAGTAHVSYRLTRLDRRNGVLRAVIAVSGVIPRVPWDSAAAHCEPRRIMEDLVLDVAARRVVAWTYAWTSRCDFGRIVTAGQTFEGRLVP